MANQASNGFQLLNQIGMNILPAYYQLTQPFDQLVNVNYTTSYQNTPRIDATRTDTLIGVSIINSSTSIKSVIHYTVSVMLVDRSQVVAIGSAPPGGTATIPMPPGVNIYNELGAFSISVNATTQCVGSCITPTTHTIFQGAIRFQFTP